MVSKYGNDPNPINFKDLTNSPPKRKQDEELELNTLNKTAEKGKILKADENTPITQPKPLRALSQAKEIPDAIENDKISKEVKYLSGATTWEQTEQFVRAGSGKVRLYRGLKESQLSGMDEKGSAKGEEVANEKTKRPSNAEAIKQVGEMTYGKLTEFTNDLSIAENFGRGQFVALVEIDARYLTKGSVTESGWVCKNDAPVELVKWKRGEDLIGSPKKSIAELEEKIKEADARRGKTSQPTSSTNLSGRVSDTNQPKKGSLRKPKP